MNTKHPLNRTRHPHIFSFEFNVNNTNQTMNPNPPRSLKHQRCVPPTPTTLMLEALLDGPRKKKPKKRPPPPPQKARRKQEPDAQQQHVVATNKTTIGGSRDLGLGSLSDLPSKIPSKNRCIQQQPRIIKAIRVVQPRQGKENEDCPKDSTEKEPSLTTTGDFRLSLRMQRMSGPREKRKRWSNSMASGDLLQINNNPSLVPTTSVVAPVQKRPALTVNTAKPKTPEGRLLHRAAITTAPPLEKPRRANNNDNFVRLNLKNKGGSCRGGPQKKRNNTPTPKAGPHDTDDALDDSRHRQDNRNSRRRQGKHIDPLDDYLDGAYQPTERKPSQATDSTPCCARHQLPCKLLTVKKNTTGNKGRKFYVCSMPRGDQCDHFEWKDDTLQVSTLFLCVCALRVWTKSL